MLDGGMKNREDFINEKELTRTIMLMKDNKATDESGMIAEYKKPCVHRIYLFIKFELESIMTALCKSDSGVRQGIPCLHYCLTYMSENYV